ncbi:PVC-type heme-binding CxxCH protein [Rhodopirellula sallentina]|uniref:Secreted glycosyl hydrolase n=1 Tax=Rhodopirellula sallentina SM41 TaxID=1263870 RepID=M5TYF3_9BACT|nr:PVC-type heme-binding CxxCH protein [Rhodopirellula sallentina]EMI54237.1 secreted glycosyl hydrolase [Rhodopirellula sallentina SM41]
MHKFSVFATLLAVMAAFPVTSRADQASTFEQDLSLKVLFLGDAGHHQPKARFDELHPLLSRRGIDLTYTADITDLNATTLKQYDALVVYANIDNIGQPQANALLEYVANGGGFVPLHCASYCFRNSPEVVALIGAQFQRHGTGVFRTKIAQPEHELMQGFDGFESWDETYVHHLHNDTNRTILEYRTDAEGREPWTWVRTHGTGRVFYTAWGHDSRTWTHPGFVNLVERGIRWAARRDPSQAGPFVDRSAFPVPSMTSLPEGKEPFTFTEVGAKIPNYTASNKWGEQGALKTRMQDPLPPQESAKRYVTPQGMHVELWASEDNLGGKPIAMTWDDRGRLWVCETMDYPNELQPEGKGRDRIRICEDTDRDGVADKFTLFAEGLSIPTTLVHYRGGVIVQDGRETIYLKDIDGDDKADFRQSLITGWALGDTHGGVSNFQYGLDNWIWGMQGYNASTPVINGEKQQAFRQGFWRFRVVPDNQASDDQFNAQPISKSVSQADLSEHTLRVEKLEFMRATDNNTWGLGFTEEGLVFGSTANRNPSNFLPIPNRYYEQVRGWSPKTLHSIADTHLFDPITPNVRQVDHHGGYTAGAGHSIYTARKYPQAWWNRTAFVCGPTGHLVGTFVLTPDGAGFTSTNPFNLVASDDEWAAPIMAETGPDGFVWVLDWYNYIVQHNPTPHGFQTGKGNAYESDLRDKKHGRVYRVVTDDHSKPDPQAWLNLSTADPQTLIATLKHPTMLWRRQAQRLLVEKGESDAQIIASLLALIADRQTDAIGLNVGAIHALWTLHGLNVIGNGHPNVDAAVRQALSHPSAAVRRAAALVLSTDAEDAHAIVNAGLLSDSEPQVQLAALLKLSDVAGPVADEVAAELANVATAAATDRWLLDAWTSAAATHVSQVVPALLASSSDRGLPSRLRDRLAVVCEHFARSRPTDDAIEVLLRSASIANPSNLSGLLTGLTQGWPKKQRVTLTPDSQSRLVALFDRLSIEQQSQLVQLSQLWGTEALTKKVAQLGTSLKRQVEDESLDDEERLAAAKQLVAMQPASEEIVEELLAVVTPQTSPVVSRGIIDALKRSRSKALGMAMIQRATSATPKLREAIVRVLLSRPKTTLELLASIQDGQMRISDLALDQRQALRNHPDQSIRSTAKQLLAASGGVPTANRVKLLHDWLPVAQREGNVAAGAEVFKKSCANCHRHGNEGANVGPDLTGMAVHPKAELLTHILDPNQSVEGNFRTFTVLTVDGQVITGMLGGESRTSIELIDTQAKRHTVLREDIEEMIASSQSLMPEGFESQITQAEMTDLLEFLTARGKYTPLSFSSVATVVSTKGMFGNTGVGRDRIVFPDWGPKKLDGVPFTLVDPQDGRVPNVILLHGPQGSKPPSMPKKVSLVCNGPANAIHLLGCVSGWGYPFTQGKSLTAVVRLNFADGVVEDHELRNGVHFADYIRRVDVPKSKFAFNVNGQQVRYLKLTPKHTAPLKTIDLIKGDDTTAPIFVAITVESP